MSQDIVGTRIFKALLALKTALQAEGITPPTLELQSWEDGMRFDTWARANFPAHEFAPGPQLSEYRNGRKYWVAKLLGIRIIWPEKSWHLPRAEQTS